MTDEPRVDHDDDALGPIDCIAMEFPDGRIAGDGFEALLALVERGVVGVLDLEFIGPRSDGTVGTIEISELDPADGFDLTVFDGASSGILDQSDIDEITAAIAPGSVAAVLVYEELSMLPVISAWERSGARTVASCPIAVDDLLVALDATEPA